MQNFRTTHSILLAGACVALCHPFAAMAQSGNAEAATANQGITDIVVTVRRTAESVQKTPLAITALSGAGLQAKSFQSLRDLQRTTPSLAFAATFYDPISSFISIRGQPQSDIILTAKPSVDVYIDGIYQATTVGTSIADLFGVDRVEVLKGPQGTLYGRNSTGGAITIYTAEPDLNTTSGKVQAPISATSQEAHNLLDARLGVHLDAWNFEVTLSGGRPSPTSSMPPARLS